MKIRNSDYRVIPILRSDWEEKSRSKDAEERLTRRFSESSQVVSGSKKEKVLIYNHLGRTTDVQK